MSSSVPIAVVPRETIEMTTGLMNGFWRGTGLHLSALEAAVRWMPRDIAEVSPAFKQLIPYVIVRRGDEIFATERLVGSTESRLHGRIALGIGGHVERGEDGLRVVESGLRREWHEEVATRFDGPFEFVGFVNDDSVEVGRVHLGIVFVAELGPECAITIREVDKLQGDFRTMEWLESRWERLETWSRFVASGLRD